MLVFHAPDNIRSSCHHLELMSPFGAHASMGGTGELLLWWTVLQVSDLRKIISQCFRGLVVWSFWCRGVSQWRSGLTQLMVVDLRYMCTRLHVSGGFTSSLGPLATDRTGLTQEVHLAGQQFLSGRLVTDAPYPHPHLQPFAPGDPFHSQSTISTNIICWQLGCL